MSQITLYNFAFQGPTSGQIIDVILYLACDGVTQQAFAAIGNENGSSPQPLGSGFLNVGNNTIDNDTIISWTKGSIPPKKGHVPFTVTSLSKGTYPFITMRSNVMLASQLPNCGNPVPVGTQGSSCNIPNYTCGSPSPFPQPGGGGGTDTPTNNKSFWSKHRETIIIVSAIVLGLLFLAVLLRYFYNKNNMYVFQA